MDKSHLDEVVNLAHSLISEGHSGAHIIQEHEDTLNARYINITVINNFRKSLYPQDHSQPFIVQY